MKYFRRLIFVTALLSTIAFAVAPLSADTFRPVVRGKRGAVATGHPLAAEAGLRLLRQGGNATDAGCAAILAASVLEFSHFSFGGEVPIIIKPSNGAVAVVNGQGTAPKLATRNFFLDQAKKGGPNFIPSSGILPATVPGVLDAVVTALDRFGTKSLGEVMQPAIELADGFPIDELRANYIANTRKVYEPWPSSTKVFLPNGKLPKPGEMFAQPDLARTLRGIVRAEQVAKSRGRHAALTSARD